MNSTSQVEKSLKLSYLDAFLYNLMIGAGETYLPAYALSIGLGEVFAGILSTLPLVSGAFLQLFAPQFFRQMGSAKKWVVISAFLQALSFVPLIYYANHEAPGFWTLFFVLTLYWGAGFSVGPAWNYWMGHLVPEAYSHRFFSYRNRIAQLGLLIGLVGGGVALHNRVDFLPFSSVFGSLFLFAFVCRLLSTLIVSQKVFHSNWFLEKGNFSFREIWKNFSADSRKKTFFLKIFPFIFCVNFSSPYAAPYMLAQLKFDYGAFMAAAASLFIGKMLTSYWLEKKAQGFSAQKIFIFGALTAAPLPVLWPVSDNLYFILALQLSSGMAWAFYEVGLMLIFFNDLNSSEKVSTITIYNFLNSLAIILGTLVGAELLHIMGATKTSYHFLFVFAGSIRYLVAFLLLRKAGWVKAQIQNQN